MNTYKKYVLRRNLCGILSFLLNTLPFICACVYVFIFRDNKAFSKLLIALVASLILIAINAVFKTSFRSAQWILFFGVYYAIGNIPKVIVYFLIAIGICVMLDDFIVAPLFKHYKLKALSAKTTLEVLEEK